MVVFGDREKALDFIKDDKFIETPTAPESCYGKLYEKDGYILLCGVSQSKNTYLHAVAEILDIPKRMAKETLTVKTKYINGDVSTRKIRLYEEDYIGDASLRFTKYETAFRYHKVIRDSFLGNAPTQLCSARGLLNVVDLIFRNGGGYDPLETEKPIPPKYYATSS